MTKGTPQMTKKACQALVRTRCGVADAFVPAGREGIVLARRCLPTDSEPLVLVKWKGRAGPSSHPAREVIEI